MNYYKMKLIIVSILILQLSNMTLSRDMRPCDRKSGNNEIDAKCCAREDPPSWCPSVRPSDQEIEAQISKQSKKMAMKKSGGRGPMMGASPKSSFFPTPHFTPFWPRTCPWWRWCCRYCYFRYIAFRTWPDWWGWWRCILRRCRWFRSRNQSAEMNQAEMSK